MSSLLPNVGPHGTSPATLLKRAESCPATFIPDVRVKECGDPPGRHPRSLTNDPAGSPESATVQ